MPSTALGEFVGTLVLILLGNGVVAGVLVAGIAGLVSRFTTLKEDASLAAI